MEIISIIEFKSDEFVFHKEKNGIKNNIVRIISEKEDNLLKNKLEEIKYIKIISTFIYSNGSFASFIRTIKDITRYVQDDIIIYIFTWKV